MDFTEDIEEKFNPEIAPKGSVIQKKTYLGNRRHMIKKNSFRRFTKSRFDDDFRSYVISSVIARSHTKTITRKAVRELEKNIAARATRKAHKLGG